jgi:hypothetical protein
VALVYRVGANGMVVFPSQGETVAYLDRFFWVARMGAIEVTMFSHGARVRENGVPVCRGGSVHVHEI